MFKIVEHNNPKNIFTVYGVHTVELNSDITITVFLIYKYAVGWLWINAQNYSPLI